MPILTATSVDVPTCWVRVAVPPLAKYLSPLNVALTTCVPWSRDVPGSVHVYVVTLEAGVPLVPTTPVQENPGAGADVSVTVTVPDGGTVAPFNPWTCTV